jgi:hypothetical protein
MIGECANSSCIYWHLVVEFVGRLVVDFDVRTHAQRDVEFVAGGHGVHAHLMSEERFDQLFETNLLK